MSSLEFRREVSKINEKSAIPELIGFLFVSFRRKEFKLVEEILVNREDEWKKQMQKEREERNLFEKMHCDSQLEILEMENDLKRLKKENLELKEELEKLKMEKVETAQVLLGYEEREAKLDKAIASMFSVDADIKTEACDSLENVLQKEGCNDGTLKIRKDLLHSHCSAQIGIENARGTPKVGIDGLKQENENDNLYAKVSKSVNSTCDRPQLPTVVEIIDSDDEAPGDEKPCVLNNCSLEVKSREKGVTFMESGSNDCRTQDKSKRNVENNTLDNLLPKRKRSVTDTNDNHIVKERCQGLQIVSRKLDLYSDDSSDYSSSDSEDECSESVINKVLESLRQSRRKSQKRWNFATDMRLDFLTNDELCMNAVCALYRKEFSTEKSSNSSPINLVLFNAMGGKDLAEYLIDKDPEYKLKRTVMEVQRKDSSLLGRCKELAVKYCETLFEIYQKNEDPFFPPRS